MRFALKHYFEKTPRIIQIASDAVLAAAGVYAAFGTTPSNLIVVSAVVLKMLSHCFGEGQK
jgi:hypothetical protein